MIEIRKNQILNLETKEGIKSEGIVFDYDKDRVSVLISFDSIENAKKYKELDILLVNVKTHVGVKMMFSHVIDELSMDNRLVIENSDCIQTLQRREYVRVTSNLCFKILKKDEKEFECFCLNISGGGIAFVCHETAFKIGEKVEMFFPKEEFDKEIICKGVIIKTKKDSYVAKYENLTPAMQEKIIKHVFKLVTKK